MSYQVLARKWRPRSFQTLIGQEHVVRALVNALDQQRLHHAYLFTGTRGVGKTTIARIFAKALNCEVGVSSNPCGICSACQAIDAGRFVDLLEVDAASRTKVEDTRELLENVQYAPTQGRFKVYLIDEVHMLSGHSFNALLKTLEEPPPHVKFLLATTDPQKLPVTVLSRCLQFHLRNMPPTQIQTHLAQVLDAEKISFEPEALLFVADAAHGSMRDALSLLDQAIAYGNQQVSAVAVKAMLGLVEQDHLFKIMYDLVKQDASALVEIINTIAAYTADFSQVLENLLSLLHEIALLQVVPNAATSHPEQQAQIQSLAKQFTAEEIQLFYQIGLIGRRDLPYAPSAKSGFEMVLLRMLAFRPSNQSIVTTIAPTAVTTKSSPTTAQAQAVAAPIKPQPGMLTQDWGALIANLNLSGASRAFAQQCVLTHIDTNEVKLLLEPSQAPLLNDRQKQRLNEALQAYFQCPVKLTIALGEPQMATPANIQKQHQAKQQAAATQAIHQDQQVQAILQTFNATIVQESVKPID